MLFFGQLQRYGLKPRQDSSGNFLMNCPQGNCPSTAKGKQKLCVKDTAPTEIKFKCWVCGWKGTARIGVDSSIQKILKYNKQYRPPEGGRLISPSARRKRDNNEVTHFHPELFKYLVDSRQFSENAVTSLVKDFGIYYQEKKVYFTSFFEDQEKYTFYKDIESGRYMNAIGSKFIFNFNALFSDLPYIILVEGVFDCLRLHTLGIPAIALLGKDFGRNSLRAFTQYAEKNKHVWIMLDSDIRHREDLKLRQKLRMNLPTTRIGVLQIKEGDPDEVFRDGTAAKHLQSCLESETNQGHTVKV